MIKVLGAVIASERRDMRATVKREGDAIKGEFELRVRELSVSLHEQVLECGRALREEAKAAREQADAATRRELELSKRELALLQREIGAERAVRALHDEVEVAKSEIPRLPEIEARIDAKLSQMAAEQEKTRDRVSRMRVDQSVTQYCLKEDLKELKRAQQPVVELKFESVDGVFTMKDLHPDAAAAWRRFVREMVEANEGTMFPNDPTGRVVALPRKNSNVA
jgi:chromosome segregation ATPase